MSGSVYDFLSPKEKERIMGMSFDGLNQLLTQLTDMPESEETYRYVQFILEVLQERGDNPYGLTDEFIDSEREDFYENYCGNDIEPVTDTVPESLPFVSSSQENPRKKPMHRIMRGVAVAAAITVLLCCVVSAFGHKAFRIFSYWGDGTLLFSSKEIPGREANQPMFYELDQEIMRYAEDPALVPNYGPESCIFESLEVNNTTKGTEVVATYRHDTGHISFSYSFFSSMDDLPLIELQINDRESRIYESGGQLFYISKNIDQVSIIWFTEQASCLIWGDFTEDDAIKMVDSLN